MTLSSTMRQIAALCLLAVWTRSAGAQQEILPTGMSITPTAAVRSQIEFLNPDLPDAPDFTADHPISTAVSGNTLLVLTSGFNRNFDLGGKTVQSLSNEYIFIYDISAGVPKKQQVLQIPNAFAGLAFHPGGKEFYVSGGIDDRIYIFAEREGKWKQAGEPVSLDHSAGLGVDVRPMVAGLAVNSKGSRLLAANYENDSVSLIDLENRRKIAELDLRPGKTRAQQHGVAGGEFPYWVAFKGDSKAYVSSLRDREIAVIDLHDDALALLRRIKVPGQPNKLLVSDDQTRLFVAADNSDSVNIIDTEKDIVIAGIKTTAPESIFPNKGAFKGSNPNSLAWSQEDQTLYVTNGGTNSIAVVRLEKDLSSGKVAGLIPTGWYPQSVSIGRSGSMLYVVNAKGFPGPNPHCHISLATGKNCQADNRYIYQLEKGSLLSMPRREQDLEKLTAIVARNNHFAGLESASHADAVFSFLRSRIKHVIYVVKENRTYDQVLGDLSKGNGDPSLAQFPRSTTPNHHALALRFAVLDNFFDSGEVSGIGWNWSTAARATDNAEKTIVMTSERGFSYDFEGSNRGINVGAGTLADRARLNPDMKLSDPEDQLPGTANVNAPDGPDDEEKKQEGHGYLWSSALSAGFKVRNYGFFVDTSRYYPRHPHVVPLDREPAISRTRVAFPANPELRDITDPYFRGYDQRFPDYWRFKEWERELDEFVKNDRLPQLELVRLCHDHFGDFSEAIDGVNTVETQMADNDYALGLLVEKIAHSKYAKDTLIFVVEDDAQNGPDHVDAHRSIAYVIGPYVKQGAVVSHRYNTVSMLRTIEEILGIKPLGLNDALQEPMTEVFSKDQPQWDYTSSVPAFLCSTELPLPQKACKAVAASVKPKNDSAYWDQQTRGFDFSQEDKLDSALFNQILWKGLMGDQPYPAERTGKDLRAGRKQLLKPFATKPQKNEH